MPGASVEVICLYLCMKLNQSSSNYVLGSAVASILLFELEFTVISSASCIIFGQNVN
jgi:hypothetical protein